VFGERLRVIQSPRPDRASLQDELHRLLRVELDAYLLYFGIRQKPDQRFVVKIDHLDAIAPRIAKIAAKRRLQFELVFLGEFLSNLLKLCFVANHDPEMPHVCPLNLVDFENGEKLMLTQFEERVAFAAAHLFQIENILVERHRLLDIIHFNGHMIASINLHAHVAP